MAIVAKNTLTATENGTPPIQRYETAEILVSRVSQEEYDDGSSEIIFSDAAVNEAESMGKRLPNGDYYIQKYNSDSDVQSAKFFIGMGFRGNTDFWFGFVDKKIIDGNTYIPEQQFQVNMLSYYVTNNTQVFTITNSQLNGAKPLGSDIVCTFYDDIKSALAFRVGTCISSDTLKSSYLAKNNITSSSVEVPDENNDINSFDVFNEDIIILKYTLNSSDQDMASNGDVNILNTHADMSYIPLHDGISSELGLCKSNISANEYFNIELLGRSKNDLDRLISMANPNPDPYFTEDTIRENFKFGRIHEEYQDYFDRSFRIIQNPGIHNNISGTMNVGGGGVDFISCDTNEKTLTWCTDISKMESLSDYYQTMDAQPTKKRVVIDDCYSDRDYDNLKVIVFNVNTLGKNPYFIEDLSSLTGGNPITADYNNPTDFTDVSISGTNLNIVGSYYGNLMSRHDSNRSHGISSLVMSFDKTTKLLNLTFKAENDLNIAYIDKNQVKVILYNTNDKSVFSYYHYLDVNG